MRFFFLDSLLSHCIHDFREADPSRVLGSLLPYHKLIDFSDHLEVFVEYFTLVHQLFCCVLRELLP